MISARQRLLRIRLLLLWRPTANRRQVVATVAAVLLGFGAVAGWRAAHSDTALATARPEQLLTLLDSLNARSERLQAEQRALAVAKQRLESGSNAAAIAEARKRLQVLNVLAGTVPARGAGITIVIADPDRIIPASIILDTIQELRDAGAEAIQMGKVRVVANTWVSDIATGGVRVSGVPMQPPYTITAIGEPATMKTALGIPGGITEAVQGAGGTVRVAAGRTVAVTAVVPAR